MTRTLVKIPLARVADVILVMRDEKVILDTDLAKLYGVETRALIQAVKRNIRRFPSDFMFQLTRKAFEALRSQFVISNGRVMIRAELADGSGLLKLDVWQSPKIFPR